MVSAIEPMAVVMKPAARNGLRIELVRQHADERPPPQRRPAATGRSARPSVDIGDEAREGADRHVRGEREVRETQHGKDGGQADRRHRQDGAGHHAVEDELQDLHAPTGRPGIRHAAYAQVA